MGVVREMCSEKADTTAAFKCETLPNNNKECLCQKHLTSKYQKNYRKAAALCFHTRWSCAFFIGGQNLNYQIQHISVPTYVLLHGKQQFNLGTVPRGGAFVLQPQKAYFQGDHVLSECASCELYTHGVAQSMPQLNYLRFSH